MIRLMLLTGAAALAIGSAATAAPQGEGQQGKNERSQKQAKAGNSQKQAQGKAQRQVKPGKANAGRGEVRVARVSNDRRPSVRAKQNGRGAVKSENRRDDRLVRVIRDDRGINRDSRLVRTSGWDDNDNRRGVWANNGCPPGLAKKPVACVPPGQVKNMVGQSLGSLRQRVAFRELPQRLRSMYRDSGDHYYRYGNGYVYQVNRKNDLISSLLPLFGVGTTVGQQFPAAYANSYLPTNLRPFYANSPNTSYRYANGYVYKVNPLTGLVQGVDPALGYGYGYGQMMPASYSAYNLPYQYRSQYQDNNDHYYRYAPGSIYRVDAGSGLIDSVAALLMPGGLAVGQQIPMGYDAYNLPTQYRSQYYDSPQNMYRYANGNIYQVDPTTRLVTAIVSALI